MRGIKYLWRLALCAAVLLSCGRRAEVPLPEQVSAPGPLAVVRQLEEENKQRSSVAMTGLRSYPKEMRTILERGRIVFGMTAADQKPFFYKDEQTGRLIGLDVELAYSIANRLGVRAVFNREATSFDGVVLKVVRKEVDVALSKLSRTTRRSALVRFTRPYITFRQALLLNRLELAKVSSEDNLPLFIRRFTGTMAVIENSSYVGYAGVNFPNALVKTYATWGECVDALFAGAVLAVYRDEGEILIVNETRENSAILMKPVFINDTQDPIAMAVSHEAPLLEAWLNTFLEEYLLQNSEELTVGRIVKKHFGQGGGI
ncbi:MAG: ABC transporter substrate-binding protein [Spirochaetia bacterium]|jgi:ABC-type amino acid transport substrate-binding protein|nr:ABC transporter substrate-binding protein [Spirochaetia bacterium]